MRLGLVRVALGISIAGCGDSEVTEDNVGPKLGAAMCEAQANCCGSQGHPLTADQRQLCELTAGAVLFHPSGWIFHPEFADQCVKAAQAYRCLNRSAIETVCRRVYTAPPAATSECHVDSDCPQPSGGRAACLGPEAGQAMCEAVRWFGREGAPCDVFEGVYTCVFYEGLTCVPDSPNASTGTCRKVSKAGETCGLDRDCVLGDFCDQHTNTCAPRGAPGVACDPTNGSDDCESGPCTDGVCTSSVACVVL